MKSATDKHSRLITWKTIIGQLLLAAILPYVLSSLFIQTTTHDIEGRSTDVGGATTDSRGWDFPLPSLHRHKSPPNATYSGACWDDPHNDVKATWSQNRVDIHLHVESDHGSTIGTFDHDDGDSNSTLGEEFSGYQPAGQHMLMDIQNVDPAFLLDMKRLSQSLVETTTQSGLTLLSYHCHDLHAPMGVSCIGVLLESHVSLHTWPQAGILSLDLFTCGPGSLLPLVPLLETLFAIPAKSAMAARPISRWLYKKRGYRDYQFVDEDEDDEAELVVGGGFRRSRN